MVALEFKKAKKEQVRIKVSIAGPAGSGKTMSSLLMAYGLTRAEFPNLSEAEVWDKIVLCDTENGSSALYVGTQVGTTTIGEFNTIPMSPPYTAQSFMDAVHMCEQHGMNVIIIDSLSHVWQGESGLLDEQNKIASRTGNSFQSWRQISPIYNKLIDTILQSPCHVIADVRAKMDYQQTKSDNGKTQVKALGMGLVMRDGFEYETTVSFMLDYDHVANATKDRTGLFDGKYFVIDANTGKTLYEWLSSGAPAAPKSTVQEPVKVTEVAPAPATPDPEQLQKARDAVDALIKPLVTEENKKEIVAKIKSIIGVSNYMKCNDISALRELYKAFKTE